jgi:predicted PurR-regulated permease PerM
LNYFAFGAALFIFGYILRDAIFPFVIAFLISYALNPVISRLVRLKIPRAAAILILFAVIGLSGASLAMMLFSKIETEIVTMAGHLPEYGKKAADTLGPFLQKAGAFFGFDAAKATQTAMEKFGSMPMELLKYAYGVAGGAVSSLTSMARTLLSLLIVPVAAFYLMLDFLPIRDWFVSFAPARHRESVLSVFHDINHTLAAYLLGELIVMLSLVAVYTAGLLVIGAPMAFMLGAISGLAVIVPYLVYIVGFLPSLLLTYLNYGFSGQLLAVFALYVFVGAFEGFYLTPKVMKSSVGLHPVAIMMSIFIGGLLFGAVGVFAAVPLAAVVNVLLSHAVKTYKASSFYTGEKE